ncbi:Trafficking protein particle complex subunit 4 [Yarrowia sp. C11]|nr:Trafficking protein particle complex subunit 4 [Yarrowia sp. E02]KAG5372412.1 Trafficking protein particle complex subunit 4 [Yarrowia sp. C11]
MTVYSLYILNKAGGLIFQRDYGTELAKLSSNDYLVLAGTFHGVHAISAKLSPIEGSSGIQTMETEKYALTCFQTVTGIKFLLITDLRQQFVDSVLRRVYQLFADYVMKSPFYQLDMPIRCSLFDLHLNKYLESVS